MNERQGKQSKYTLSFRIVSVSFPPASSPATSLMSCIFGCTRTHTHSNTQMRVYYLCYVVYLPLLIFAFFFVFEDHGNKHRDRERQWQRAKNERRVTTATIDVRKATDGIDDGSSDVNLTERKHTHICRDVPEWQIKRARARERAQPTNTCPRNQSNSRSTRAVQAKYSDWAPPLYKKLSE